MNKFKEQAQALVTNPLFMYNRRFGVKGVKEMMGVVNRQEVIERKDNSKEDTSLVEQSIVNALTHTNPTKQLLLTSKPLFHRPEAGVNPLVDAAAYLFSIMGKLKHIKSYKNLARLHKELIEEIENFQETLRTYSYSMENLAEYIPISCYALCMTLDDIILNTLWGSQGRWDEYRLVFSFSDQPLSHENFLIILERLVRDPAIYIDVMEFMYICLSLGMGYKYQHQVSGFNNEQLEQILQSLYKRIRAHRGNFNKILSPYSIKPPTVMPREEKMPGWLMILITTSFFLGLFAGAKYLFDINIVY